MFQIQTGLSTQSSHSLIPDGESRVNGRNRYEGIKRIDKSQESIIYELVVIFAFVNSIGFPGRYTLAFGSSFGTLIEYISFLLQIIVMVISSGSSLLDFKIINLQEKYRGIYFMLFVITVTSMMVTISRPKQMISCTRVAVTAFFGIWIIDTFPLEKVLELIYKSQIIFVFFYGVFAVGVKG